MRFHLSEEQAAIQDAVRGTLADRWPLERLHGFADGGEDFDVQSWEALAGLGLFGILAPGSGMGLLEAALVSEVVGEAAAPGPVIAQMLAVAAAGAATDPAAANMVEGLVSGASIATLAIGSDL
ncbi:MAG: acyl-CoA dehydrogenase family protein, partial [Sphingobium sp.]